MNYDEWKLMSPDDERPQEEDDECEFCGARRGEGCWLEDDCDEGERPPCCVVLSSERDPDTWREEREEAKRDREMDR
jgi:hypothetical protein